MSVNTKLKNETKRHTKRIVHINKIWTPRHIKITRERTKIARDGAVNNYHATRDKMADAYRYLILAQRGPTTDNHFIPLRICFNSATTASPTSTVLALPPRSRVRIPLSMVRRTASSIAFDSAGRRREYCNIIATERIVPIGLTIPRPEMSGAEPRDGESFFGKTLEIRKLTMNRLIDTIALVLPIRNTTQTRTWQQTNASGDYARLVTNDVSKQVAGNHNTIQFSRGLHQDHSRAINQLVLELQLRELFFHNLVNHLSPQST